MSLTKKKCHTQVRKNAKFAAKQLARSTATALVVEAVKAVDSSLDDLLSISVGKM